MVLWTIAAGIAEQEIRNSSDIAIPLPDFIGNFCEAAINIPGPGVFFSGDPVCMGWKEL